MVNVGPTWLIRSEPPDKPTFFHISFSHHLPFYHWKVLSSLWYWLQKLQELYQIPEELIQNISCGGFLLISFVVCSDQLGLLTPNRMASIHSSPSLSPPLTDIIFFRLFLSDFPEGFKRLMLGRDFHNLIKNISLPSPINVGSHNPLISRPNIIAGTPPRIHPLEGSVSSRAHRPVSTPWRAQYPR